MSVREVASAEFYELSRRPHGKLLAVQFTATWCGPCRRVAPQYEALARRTPDVEFVKVYEHNSRDAIFASGVNSFPTFHFYCGGVKVDECRGANIQGVEQKVLQHKGSASATAGPITVKLRFEREKPRQSGDGFILVSQEEDIEVDAVEGLDIFRFQVLSITDIETEDQLLVAGESNASIDNDTSLASALRSSGGGVYGNYPVVRVSKRAQRKEAPSKRNAIATEAAAAGVWEGCCSRTFFGKRRVVQPAYVIREEGLLPQADLTKLQKNKTGPEAILIVCKACAENCFMPGRAEHCPAISESAGFVCQSKEACGKGYGSDLFSGRADAGTEVYPPASPAALAAETAAATAADLMYYSARGLAAGGGTENAEMAAMRQRIQSGIKGALVYESSPLQDRARAVLPTAESGSSIEQRAAEMAAAAGCSELEGKARALLSWFKKDFFKWTNKPPCMRCGAKGPSMVGKANGRPNAEETADQASRVELYDCKECGAETRFPRYNNPGKLLETRNGRCGEFANCFTLLCRAIGLEARRVMDWTDHVWSEIWIPDRNMWMHADACENKIDKPLMYEQGWNKRLSYVIAFSHAGAVDVTRRYTRRWLETLSRRNLVPEKWLKEVLANAFINSPPVEKNASIVSRLEQEQRELEAFESMGCDVESLDDGEKEGRQSGDAEWVASRGEGELNDGTPSSPGGADLEVDPTSSKVNTASPLLGAPMGALQQGGSLALCVAAVVEGSGDASVLVGGKVVNRLSGKGKGALCAAVVSATTGVVLDARTFSLGSAADSSEMAEWFADLPDRSVIVVAAGGRGGKTGVPDRRFAKIMNELVGDEEASEDRRATSWTLLGWKGAGTQQWARRQDRTSGKRCALYVELLLSPPQSRTDDNAVGTRPAFTQVEFKDKICVCPLMSLQSQTTVLPDDATSPARGICYRDGEPTELVGPNVDLVDCVGWTTMLQTRRAYENTAESGGENKLEELVATAWTVTTVSPALGGWHDDTERFDDGAVGCPAFVMGGCPIALSGEAPFLPAGRVREIVAWGGDCLNGVQVVYDVSGDAIHGPKRMGDHGLYRQSSLLLDVDGGEVVTEVTIRAGDLVDSLQVRTSMGREKKWGGDGGESTRTWKVPDGSTFLGFHGGVGGHIHCLGVTLSERVGQSQEQTGNVTKETPWALSPSSSIVKTNLYNSDPVSRACALLLAFNSTPPTDKSADEEKVDASIVTALETARKYADNLLASPLDPKVSRIRLANGFFDRKIGRLSGGGGVIRAMGFRLADEGGRMHYIFRRDGAGGGLEGLRRARQTLTELLAKLTSPGSLKT